MWCRNYENASEVFVDRDDDDDDDLNHFVVSELFFRIAFAAQINILVVE